MTIRPIRNMVVIKPEESQEETFGSIIIPDSSNKKIFEGIVVSVGPGKLINGKIIPIPVSEGDKVLYQKYNGTEIQKSGQSYLIVPDDSIIAIVN